MKTVLQEIMDVLEHEKANPPAQGFGWGVQVSINKLYHKLQQEKEQIKRAFEAGAKYGYDSFHADINGCQITEPDFEDYFDKTYPHKN